MATSTSRQEGGKVVLAITGGCAGCRHGAGKKVVRRDRSAALRLALTFTPVISLHVIARDMLPR
jgi:hypothetical protein